MRAIDRVCALRRFRVLHMRYVLRARDAVHVVDTLHTFAADAVAMACAVLLRAVRRVPVARGQYT